MSRFSRKTTSIVAALAMIATMAFPMSALSVKAAKPDEGMTEAEFLREIERREHEEMELQARRYGDSWDHGDSWDGSTVKVTVENSPYGYVEVYTPQYDKDGNAKKIKEGDYYRQPSTYVPIGETVEVPKGALLTISGSGVSVSKNEYYKCESVQLVKADGSVETLTDYEGKPSNYKYGYELTEDITIRGNFTKNTETSSSSSSEHKNYYYVSVSPSRIGAPGAFSGKLECYGYDAEGNWQSNIPFTARLNTELAGVKDYNKESYQKALNLFKYDDASKTLSAANLSELGSYSVPFVVNVNGVEYATNTSGEYTSSITASVTVGSSFYVDMLAYSNGYSSGWYGCGSLWGVSSTDYPTYRSALNAIGEPALYGYSLVGYVNNGETNKDAQVNTEANIDWAGEYYYVNLNPVFKNAAGQYYYAPGEKDRGNSDTPAVSYPGTGTTPGDNIVAVDSASGMVLVKDGVTGATASVPAEYVTEGKAYRMYDPSRGEHFYTKNTAEMQSLVASGWVHEESADFTVIAADDSSAIPVYRLYNPNDGGMHFYTENAAEAANLAAIGWSYEGISHYVYAPGSGKGAPQYRLYNPNSTNGEHNWTADEAEKDMLVAMGWQFEGASWEIK